MNSKIKNLINKILKINKSFYYSNFILKLKYAIKYKYKKKLYI